jgi:dihydrofolate reductase
MIVGVAAPGDVPYGASGAVIGVGGGIPWRYKGDMARFKRVTLGSVVIMGRKTWESLGRPLPGRRNLVVSRGDVPGVETFRSLADAVAAVDEAQAIWLIGGAAIYGEGMRFADTIDVTYVPDRVDAPEAVRFPPIDPAAWDEGPLVTHEDDPALSRRVYTRRPR